MVFYTNIYFKQICILFCLSHTSDGYINANESSPESTPFYLMDFIRNFERFHDEIIVVFSGGFENNFIEFKNTIWQHCT